jgi:hypothetical protein
VVVADRHRPGPRGVHLVYRGIQPVVRTMHVPTIGRALLAQLELSAYAQRSDAIYADVAMVAAGDALALVPGWLLPVLVDLGRRSDRAGLSLPAHPYTAIDIRTGRVRPMRPSLELPRDPLRGLRGLDGNEPSDRFLLDRSRTVDFVISVEGTQHQLGAFRLPAARALYDVGSSAMNLERVGSPALTGLERLVREADTVQIAVPSSRHLVDVITDVMKGRGA